MLASTTLTPVLRCVAAPVATVTANAKPSVQAWVEESCQAQGIAVRVVDAPTLRHIATVLGGATGASGTATPHAQQSPGPLALAASSIGTRALPRRTPDRHRP